MKKKKVKEWLQNHKKDIIIGVTAAGSTALYFLIKNKKVKGITAGITLSLNFADEGRFYENEVYGGIHLNDPGLTLQDLGSLSNIIKKGIPMITDDTEVKLLTANYRKEKI